MTLPAGTPVTWRGRTGAVRPLVTPRGVPIPCRPHRSLISWDEGGEQYVDDALLTFVAAVQMALL